MRVQLINALPNDGATATSDWDTTQEDIGAFPPIGLSYLAGYLAEKTGHQVEILDAVAERLTYDQIAERILAFKPDMVGSTAFTPTFYGNLVLAKLVKKLRPDCYVCLGGIRHVKMFLEETLSHPEIDFVVRGEGEEIFAHLLNALENKTPLAGVNGISYKAGGRVFSPGPDGYLKDINEHPMPAFDLLPLHLYHNRIGSGKKIGTISTSRGCPYDCTFCDRPYRSFRSYSTERILEEVGHHYKQGVREFVFFDDMFNITPDRTIGISDALAEHYPDIVWSFRGRADRINEDVIKSIKRSGCTQVMFGLEATTNKDLAAIRKKITVEKFMHGVALCKKAGIKTSANFILGLPTHTSREDIVQLSRFSVECGIDYAQFNILVPYAGTEIYDDAVARKLIPGDFWSNYVRDPQPNAFIPVSEEHLSRDELSRLLKMCYQRFYLTPSKVLARVLEVRSLSEFRMKFIGFLTIIGLGGYKRKKNVKARFELVPEK